MTHLFGYINGCQGAPSDGIRNGPHGGIQGMAGESARWARAPGSRPAGR